MGSNLAKAPLIAVCYAALLGFVADFVNFSEEYAPLWEAYATPGNSLLLAAYCLWLCLAVALVYAAAQAGGPRLVAVIGVSMLVSQLLAPLLEQLLRGEASGSMTGWDTLVYLIVGAVGMVLALVLCLLLYQGAQTDARQGAQRGGKLRFKVKHLLITLLVLPFIYLVLYFLGWYFLGWRDDAVRLFWDGSQENRGIAAAFVHLLLEMPDLIPIALLRGLCYAGAALLLGVQTASKRTLYLAANTMLFAGAAVAGIIPTPAVPESVRWTLVAQSAAVLVVYGVVSALLLHRTIELPEPVKAAAPAGRPGAQQTARPGAVRR